MTSKPPESRFKGAPSDLKKLSSRVLISESSSAAESSAGQQSDGLTTKPPGVVLLSTWMDARISYAQKYSDVYRGLFPNATIVVVLIRGSFHFMTDAAKEAALAPILTTLLREKESDNLRNGILVHSMSNGGSFQLAVLQRMLNNSPLNAPYEPPIALIMDSAPGDNALASALSGNTPRNPVLRMLATPIVSLLVGIHHVVNTWIIGKPPLFSALRAAIHEPAVLPSISNEASSHEKAAPRLYIFSDTDKMVLAKDVRRHIDQAIAAGFDVAVERFGRSPHVAHARTDPEQYWTAVLQLWTRAVKSKL